jgi:hypothetical protein
MSESGESSKSVTIGNVTALALTCRETLGFDLGYLRRSAREEAFTEL